MLNKTVRIPPLLLLLLFFASTVFAAAAKPAPEVKIGVVDVEKAWGDYDLMKKYSADFDALRAKKKAQLDRRDTNRLLNEDQLKELDTLYEKANSTDADKARIKALEDEANKLDAELKALQSKKEPTEDDKKRLEQLQTQSKKMDETLQKLAEQFDSELADLNAKLAMEVKNNITAAIQKIAEQKSFLVVLEKSSVLFGGTDLTNLVVEQLNKKK